MRQVTIFDKNFKLFISYKNEKSSGKVTEIIGLNEELTGKHVLILEDILDTGITLDYLRKNILKKKPVSLKIAALLFKKEALKKDIKPDYFGIEVPDRFLIGYGLDYKGLGRNYKDLYVCLDG